MACETEGGWCASAPTGGVTAASSTQIEIGDGAELTAEFLYDEVHPKQHAFRQAFAKPKGPGGKRGHKRLIRGPGENGDDS